MHYRCSNFFIFLFFAFTHTTFHAEIITLQEIIKSYDDIYWEKNGVSPQRKNELKNNAVIDKKISVIIPCYYKHARQLYSLLHLYEQQTRLPDEVIISLSEINLINEEIITQLQNELWAFPVTLIMTPKKKCAAENRNLACSYAKGDVFLGQDADDIPHPQRVEIIHYFFSTYNIDHLTHRQKIVAISDTTIPFERFNNFDKIQFTNFSDYPTAREARFLADGNVGITRHVFNTIKWPIHPRNEDVPYNTAVYKKFKNCIVVRSAIYAYRRFLSSTKEDVVENELSLEVMNTKIREKQYKIKTIKLHK